MRYHYETIDQLKQEHSNVAKVIDTPLLPCSECSVFTIGTKSLGVVVQYYNGKSKATYWGPITDGKLLSDIYRNNNFPKIFNEWAKEPDELGYFPVTTVRKLMWALRMKPLPKERWETTFDRRFI